MKKSKIGNASLNSDGTVALYLNIKTWPTMLEVRQHLRPWLPDMPVWKSTKHWVEQSYFRNEFAFDGEYVLDLPNESLKKVCELLRLDVNKLCSAEVRQGKCA
jgi:hypothetical protein